MIIQKKSPIHIIPAIIMLLLCASNGITQDSTTPLNDTVSETEEPGEVLCEKEKQEEFEELG